MFPLQVSADENLINKIKKEGLRIVKFSENLYYLKLKNKKPKTGTEYIIVRIINDIEFELLGQGKIEGSQKNISYLKLIENGAYKRPAKGDYAIPLASGLEFEDITGEESDVDLKTTAVITDEKGYLQLGYSLLMGSYEVESTTLANSAKAFEYSFVSYYLKWYFDFAWRVGIEFNFYGSDIPTSDYYRDSYESERSYMNFKIMYRLKKWENTKFRSVFLASFINDEFETRNRDEFLLTTAYSLFGVGTRINYELTDHLIKNKGFGYKLSLLYLSLLYYPVVAAEDTGVSRGTEVKSSLSYSYDVGADLIIYWDKIPFIKRWLISLNYETTVYDLNFSGATVSESGFGYKIPPGTVAKEVDSNFKVMIGFRVEDFIGKFFKPR